MKCEVLLLVALATAAVAGFSTSSREIRVGDAGTVVPSKVQDADLDPASLGRSPSERLARSPSPALATSSSEDADDISAETRVTEGDHEFTKDFYTRRLLGLNKRETVDEQAEPKGTDDVEVLTGTLPGLTVELVGESLEGLEGTNLESTTRDHMETTTAVVEDVIAEDDADIAPVKKVDRTEEHEDIDNDHFPKGSKTEKRRRKRFVDEVGPGLDDLYDLGYFGAYGQDVYPLVRRETHSASSAATTEVPGTARVLRSKRQLIFSSDYITGWDDLPDFKRKERALPEYAADATTTTLPETGDVIPLDEENKATEQASVKPTEGLPDQEKSALSSGSTSAVPESSTAAVIVNILKTTPLPLVISSSSSSNLAEESPIKRDRSDSSSSSSSSDSSSSSSSESAEHRPRRKRSPQQGQFDGFLLSDFSGYRHRRSTSDESSSGEEVSSSEEDTTTPQSAPLRRVSRSIIDESILGDLPLRRYRRSPATDASSDAESTSISPDAAPITYAILPNGTQTEPNASIPALPANSSTPIKIVHLYTVHSVEASPESTTTEGSSVTEDPAMPPSPNTPAPAATSTGASPQGPTIFAKGHLVTEEPPAQMFNSGFSQLPVNPQNLPYPQEGTSPSADREEGHQDPGVQGGESEKHQDSAGSPSIDRGSVAYPQESDANQPPCPAPKNQNRRPDIVEKTIQVNPDGTFIYSFETSDGTRVAQAGMLRDITAPQQQPPPPQQQQQQQQQPQPQQANTVFGGYSYTAPDGTLVSLRYIADENGFRPISESATASDWSDPWSGPWGARYDV